MSKKTGAGYKPGDNETTVNPDAVEETEEQDAETQEAELVEDDSQDSGSEEVAAEEEEEEEEEAESAPPPVSIPRKAAKSAPKAEETGSGSTAPKADVRVVDLGEGIFQHGTEEFTGSVPCDLSTERGKFLFDELTAAKERRDKRVGRLMEQHRADGIYNPAPARIHYTLEAPVK